jgi:hypothetical protein
LLFKLPLRRVSAGRVRALSVAVRMPDAMAIEVRLLRRIGGVSGSDAEHAIDAADNATDRTANHRADRASRVVAHIGAMGDTVGNALRLRRERRNERCGDDGGCEHNLELHVENPFLMSRGRHMSSNEGDSAAIAVRCGAATTVKRWVRQTGHTSARAGAGTSATAIDEARMYRKE